MSVGRTLYTMVAINATMVYKEETEDQEDKQHSDTQVAELALESKYLHLQSDSSN